MPCSGEEGRDDDIRNKNGIFERNLDQESERKRETKRERERVSVSSGRFKRRKEQRPVKRRGNCLAKAIQQTGKQSLSGSRGRWGAVGGEGGTPGSGRGATVRQSHRTTGGRAGAGSCGPASPPASVQLSWAGSHPPPPPPLLPPHTSSSSSSSQVELLGSDMLQLLPQHAEGGPHHRVQGPALLHQVIDHGRAAVRGVHLVTLLYPGHHLLQRLPHRHRGKRLVFKSAPTKH